MNEFEKNLYNIYTLSNIEIDLLLSYMDLKSYKKGDILIKEGTKDNNLYIIKTGVIRAFRYNNGEEIALWFASCGEIVIPLWGYCRNDISAENIEFETDCQLYSISKTKINDLCNKFILIANLFRKIFENHALVMEEFLLFFADNKLAEERYIAMMKRHPEILNQVPLKKLASFLYVTPQSLSRIRAGLKRKS